MNTAEATKVDILERLQRFDNPMIRDAADEIERLRAIEKRAQTLYNYAREKGGMGDEVTDCQYILEDRGLWKNVLP